jgi:hypothetical protein
MPPIAAKYQPLLDACLPDYEALAAGAIKV